MEHEGIGGEVFVESDRDDAPIGGGNAEVDTGRRNTRHDGASPSSDLPPEVEIQNVWNSWVSAVGELEGLRCATREEILAEIHVQQDTIVPPEDQHLPFNSFAHDANLVAVQRRKAAKWHAENLSCTACAAACVCGARAKLLKSLEMLSRVAGKERSSSSQVQEIVGDQFLCAACGRQCRCGTLAKVQRNVEVAIKVTLIYNSRMEPVVSSYIVPWSIIYREWMSDPAVRASIVEHAPRHADYGTFVGSDYFRALCAHNTFGAAIPLCLIGDSDATNVVQKGKRSLWPAYLALGNSTLGVLDTARICGLVPKLQSADFPHLNANKMHLLRVVVFQLYWAAMAETGHVKVSNQGGIEVRLRGESGVARVYPCFSLFVCDTKDAAYFAATKTSRCLRCGASSESPQKQSQLLEAGDAGAARRAEVAKLHVRAPGQMGAVRDAFKALGAEPILSFGATLRHFDPRLNTLHIGQLNLNEELLVMVGLRLQVSPGATKRAHERFAALGERRKLWDKNGKLDIGPRTANEMEDLVDLLPFALFDVFLVEDAWIIEGILLWLDTQRLWGKPSPSAGDLRRLELWMERVQSFFLRLCAATMPERSMHQKPVFHLLLHAAEMIRLFGSQLGTTKQFEALHTQVKRAFRWESNHSKDEPELLQQILRALWLRGFAMRIAAAPESPQPAPAVARGAALVGRARARTTLGELFSAVVDGQRSPLQVERVYLEKACVRYCLDHGEFDGAVTKSDVNVAYVRALSARVCSGWHDQATGKVARAFVPGRRPDRDCVLRLSDGQFCVVLLVLEWQNALFCNSRALLICKMCSIVDDQHAPFNLPLIRDSFPLGILSYAFVGPSQVMSVHRAYPVGTPPQHAIARQQFLVE